MQYCGVLSHDSMYNQQRSVTVTIGYISFGTILMMESDVTSNIDPLVYQETVLVPPRKTGLSLKTVNN
jgi:hypothetical protein